MSAIRFIIVVIVLKITCAPATYRFWDASGAPLQPLWRTDGTVEVSKVPGAVAVRTHDPDCGVVRWRMEGAGRWWEAKVECGNGWRYLDLTRTR